MAQRMMGGGRRKKPTENKHQKVHVRRGDLVKVIRGNHAGQQGRVIRVIPEQNRVVVEGVNMRTKHQRPTNDNPEGGRITFEGAIDASNVMLIDPTSGEPTRIRYRVEEDGTKERIGVKSGNPIPKSRE